MALRLGERHEKWHTALPLSVGEYHSRVRLYARPNKASIWIDWHRDGQRTRRSLRHKNLPKAVATAIRLSRKKDAHYVAGEVQKFWSFVDRSDTDGCWEWTGATEDDDHRARCRLFGKPDRAARHAHRLIYGEIPDGLYILHHCDNPTCVRPSHLYAGTHQDNMRDMVERGRAWFQQGEAA